MSPVLPEVSSLKEVPEIKEEVKIEEPVKEEPQALSSGIIQEEEAEREPEYLEHLKQVGIEVQEFQTEPILSKVICYIQPVSATHGLRTSMGV